MQSHINLFFLVCLVSLASVGLAQETATLPGKTVSAADANKADVPSFPYTARITDDNVNIRSGPGTHYYSCGKLNKTDRVKVVASQFSWSCVVPPAGSFSWISKRHVNIDPNEPNMGIVTGGNVRVWAGSNHLKPIHSTRLQLKLNKDEKVRLMGEEKGDYYKIAPPDGVYLWVSTKYTKPLPIGEVSTTVEPRTDPKGIASVVPTKTTIEDEKLKEYYALEKQIQAERNKPMAQQNYASIKKALLDIAGHKAAGKAARYSKFAIEQIKRYELALEVGRAVRLQNEQLQQVRDGIDKARAARLAQVQNLGRFAAIGQLKSSRIYGFEPELMHYQIIDDSGRILCYALPVGLASKMDLGKLIGQKVGLVGTIEPHRQTKKALVRFTEIAQLN